MIISEISKFFNVKARNAQHFIGRLCVGLSQEYCNCDVLHVEFEAGKPVIRWHDEWKPRVSSFRSCKEIGKLMGGEMRGLGDAIAFFSSKDY